VAETAERALRGAVHTEDFIEPLRELTDSHESGVRCVQLGARWAVSSSNDKTMKVWAQSAMRAERPPR
jgi:hypothetical protein